MKLSIVIPSFNSYKTTFDLAKSLESLPDIEIIVVNDGSSQVYGSLPLNVNYLKLPKNLGAVRARYEGWKIASGEFIYFFDSDDQINYKILKQAIPLFKKSSDIFVFNMSKELKSEKIKIVARKINHKISSLGYASYFGNKIFRANVIEQNMFDFDARIFQDENFIMRFSAKAKGVQTFYNLPPISKYLYNHNSISKQKWTYNHISKLIKNVELLIPFVETFNGEKKLHNKLKKQLGRMITIAAGKSLSSNNKKEVSTKVLNDINQIMKKTTIIKFPINYKIAFILIKFVKKIKLK